eukprot:g8911.t1
MKRLAEYHHEQKEEQVAELQKKKDVKGSEECETIATVRAWLRTTISPFDWGQRGVGNYGSLRACQVWCSAPLPGQQDCISWIHGTIHLTGIFRAGDLSNGFRCGPAESVEEHMHRGVLAVAGPAFSRLLERCNCSGRAPVPPSQPPAFPPQPKPSPPGQDEPRPRRPLRWLAYPC